MNDRLHNGFLELVFKVIPEDNSSSIFEHFNNILTLPWLPRTKVPESFDLSPENVQHMLEKKTILTCYQEANYIF